MGSYASTQEDFLGLDPSMKGPFVVSGLFHIFIIVLTMVTIPYIAHNPPTVSTPISVEIVEIAEITQTNKIAAPKKEEKKKAEEIPKPPKPSPPQMTAEKPPEIEKPKPVEKIKPPDKKLLKPAPPKPQAKAEPKKEPEKDFQSLLKNLAPDAKEKTLETPDAVETAAGEQAQMVPLGPRVTMSEMDAVKQRLSPCWIYNIGGKNAEDIVVSVRVVFNPDTTVQQATIMDQTQYTLNPQYRAAADAAVRALRNPKCSPLPLPREKYNQWQTTVINFDPREMLQ